jgi:hypothetical protein
MLSESTNVVGIIGAGWYGCHLAKKLLENGVNVEIIERTNGVFNESSSKNQCRLHQGLHYVRSWQTRKECMAGYHKLLEEYPMAAHEIQNNYYAVARDSNLDFETIQQILDASLIPYDNLKTHDLTNVEHVFKCQEMVFDHEKMKEYFTDLLANHLYCNETVLSVSNSHSPGEPVHVKTSSQDRYYSIVIDCTYNALELSSDRIDCFYEPCLTFLYKYVGTESDHPSVTLIDGDFGSLYRYLDPSTTDKLYTLTSVKHTPINQFGTYFNAEKCIRNFEKLELERKRKLFEEEIANYVPEFYSNFGIHPY